MALISWKKGWRQWEYSADNTLEANQISTLGAAIQLIDSGEFNQAIDLLQSKINQFPENADMLALLSNCPLSRSSQRS